MRRILIDVSAAFDQRAGVGRYARNILDRLVAEDSDVDWMLLHVPTRRGEVAVGRQPPTDVDVVQVPVPAALDGPDLWALWAAAAPATAHGTRGHHLQSSYVAPRLRGGARIVTVHALAFLAHPHLTTPGTATYLECVVRREAARGSHIACVSETARKRVREWLGVPDERLRVIPDAAEERFFAAEPPSRELRAPEPPGAVRLDGRDDRAAQEPRVRPAGGRDASGSRAAIRDRWTRGVGHRARCAGDSAPRGGGSGDLASGPCRCRPAPGVRGSPCGALPLMDRGLRPPRAGGTCRRASVITGIDPVFAEVGKSFVTPVPPDDPRAIGETLMMLSDQPDGVEERAQRRAWAARYNWDRSAAGVRRWIEDLTGVHGA